MELKIKLRPMWKFFWKHPTMHLLAGQENLLGGKFEQGKWLLGSMCYSWSGLERQGSKNVFLFHSFFKKDFVYLFLEKGREGERKGEKHQCVVASHTPPTGDLASNPGMCPDRESNQWPFDLQAVAQSTESHQPGLVSFFRKCKCYTPQSPCLKLHRGMF